MVTSVEQSVPEKQTCPWLMPGALRPPSNNTERHSVSKASLLKVVQKCCLLLFSYFALCPIHVFLKKMDDAQTCKALQLFFLCIFGSLTCPKKTCFMDSLEEKLQTCGSYSGGYQRNFHNLEVTHQAVIFID
jgi:hypothetical protein